MTWFRRSTDAVTPGERPRRGDDGIRPLTTAVALLILPFLAVASVLLYLLPAETDRLFAWTIAPPLTAMVLGSAYIGGIWFFAQVLRHRVWHRVKLGFPAVLLFATLLGVATALHWDRFHPGHISFITWVTLYATTPFLVLAVLIVNRQADAGRPDAVDTVLSWPARIALAAVGAASLVAGATLFVVPAIVVGSWAWEVTPLTTRVIGAVLTLPGAVNLWLLADARWSAFRILCQAQIVSLIFLILGVVICRDQLEWSAAITAPFVGLLVVSLVAYTLTYVACERRARRETVGQAL
ncbi:MAG: hypothetical protein ABWX65_05585 [Mycetocola sp.]